MKGTLATSGSLPSSCRKRVMAVTPSIMPSSMQMSRTLAPFSTCWRATLTASSIFAFLDELGEFGRAGDVGALADHDEDAGLLGEGLRTGEAQGLRGAGRGASRLAHAPLSIGWADDASARSVPTCAEAWPVERFGNGRDVLGRVAAAAAGNVDQARLAQSRRDSGPCPADPDRSRCPKGDWASRHSGSRRSPRRLSPRAPQETDT